MFIRNQMPTDLAYSYIPNPFSDSFDPISDMQTVVIDPLLQPVTANQSVIVQDDDGNDVTANDLMQTLAYACDDNISMKDEEFMRDFFGRTMLHFDAGANYPVHRLFASQASAKQNIPLAGMYYYISFDVIPSAQALLGDFTNDDKREQFFISLTGKFEPDTLAVTFLDNAGFADFQKYVQTCASAWSTQLDHNVRKLMTDFMNLNLSQTLTESVMLRKDGHDGNNPGSFPRVLHSLMLRYAKQFPDKAYLMPFTLKQCFCPEHVVFINTDAHAHATPETIQAEWQDIITSITAPVRVVSKKSLARLTAIRTAQKNINGQAANARSNRQAKLDRYGNLALSKTAPKPSDIYRRVRRIIQRMDFVTRSQNIVHTSRSSFTRTNRRHPDDFNLPGRASLVSYKPDIHLYVDTSGSIDEEHWSSSTKTMIKLASKLGVNLYFTSFSHVLSEPSMVITRGRTQAQMWRQIQRLPKVSGGTDYAQIWRYINASKKRRHELSIIVTDFEYDPPSTKIEHPKNLYYVPCANMNYQQISYWSQNFVKSMQHIDPMIRAKLLF